MIFFELRTKRTRNFKESFFKAKPKVLKFAKNTSNDYKAAKSKSKTRK